MQAPVLVLNTNTKRDSGKKVQFDNIAAAKTVADIIRTCLGPCAMLKMILDPMGGIVLTNDGNSILREIDVSHPAAKSMLELSRAQDENVGDGTTSVIILAGEMLLAAAPFLERSIHPRVIISAYHKALEDGLSILDRIAFKVDINDDEKMLTVIKSCLGTKFINRWSVLMCKLALDAVRRVSVPLDDGKMEIDIKRFARVEKIPGGEIEECQVLDGVLLNKDVTHQKMRRRIENPRVLLLDCNLEYKKGEAQTNIEVKKESDWCEILKLEEDFIDNMCKQIIAAKPDLVITEKGVSDLAQHYLVKENITVLRRVKKTDNHRIARAVGATIVHRVDEIKESDLGTGCGLFKVEKIGDEYFTYLTKCNNPKACTIILRGAGKDMLNEVERNLQDAMNVARNVCMDPRLVPGGGAVEMGVAVGLNELANSVEGVAALPYKAVAQAMEVIPRTLIQNCGANVIRTLTALRAKHTSDKSCKWGINGNTGELADMFELGVWEPLEVKVQTLKTSIESAGMLLRIDDIVSGLTPPKSDAPAPQAQPGAGMGGMGGMGGGIPQMGMTQ